MTTVDTTGLRQEIAQSANPKRGRSIKQAVQEQFPQIARALPRATGLTAERFTRLVLTEISRTPKLAECSESSFLGALMYAAQLGVEPGPLGMCYLIPFGNQVTFVLGYRGALALARRSGEILDIQAREVYENDVFELEYGFEDKLVHRPKLDGDRGAIKLFYGVARFRDGGHYVLTLTPDEVEKRRARSKAAKSGPWVTDYLAMAKKSIVRAMIPYLPLTPESATALEQDERLIVEFDPDKDAALEITETPYDDDQGVLEAGEPSPASGADEDAGSAGGPPPASPDTGPASSDPEAGEYGAALPLVVDSFDGMTPAQLRKELEGRSLPTFGSKAELIGRLREDDQRPFE